MATISDLGKKYFERIKSSINPEKEIQNVLSDINKLRYTNTNDPLLKDDKILIVEEIIREFDFEGKERYSNFNGHEPILEHKEVVKAFSNDEFLEIIKILKGKIKK